MKSMNKKYFWAIPIVVVCVGVLVGLFFAGSPRTARAERFDEQRVQDISSLQASIDSYWQTQKKLPENLDELKNADTNVNYYIPLDPLTKERYGYEKADVDTFSVCANFETKRTYNNNEQFYGPYGKGPLDWSHEVGRKCYSYTVSSSTPSIY